MATSMAPTSLGSFVVEEDLLPGGAAVGGAIDAALGIGIVDVAERRDIDAIRVGRVDGDAADLLAWLRGRCGSRSCPRRWI